MAREKRETGNKPGKAHAPRDRPKVVVGSLISRENGDVLMTRAGKWGGKWTCQGGHLELGETLEQCLKREVLEETGLEVADISLVCVQDAISPEGYHRKSHMIFVDYSCRALDPDNVRLNHELQEFRWVSPASALEMDLNDSTRRFIHEFMKTLPGKPIA